MKSLCCRIILMLLIFILVLFFQSPVYTEEAQTGLRIHAKLAADYIHAVIKAGRTVYSKDIVDRLSKKSSMHATENWKNEDGLLLPAQFLSLSSKLSNSRGVGMRYRLKSLWAINKKNLPNSEEEKIGLEM